MSKPDLTTNPRVAEWVPDLDHRRLGLYVLALFFVAFFLVPLQTGLMTAFKSEQAVTLTPPFLPPGPEGATLDNWTTAYDILARGFVNSLAMALPATVLDVLLGSMAAYGLTLVNWRGQLAVLVLFIVGIFIPYQAVLVPLSRFWTNYAPIAEWLAPLWGLPLLEPAHAQLVELVVTHVAYGLPICMLLFRSYYATLPTSLIEAGKLDGASLARIYARIVLPLSKPMFAVVFIYQFTQIWNEFLFALTIVGSSDSTVAPITLILSGLGASISGIDFGLRMAGAFLTALPTLLIYVVFAEQFARGLETGG
jgi:glucose/mannose transport system permease protein